MAVPPSAPRVRALWRLAVAAWAGLLALHLLWHLWLAPVPMERAPGVLLLALGPLLLPVRGLLQGRPATHLWASALGLGYLTHGIVELWDGARWLGALESALAVAFFAGALYYARLRSRELRAPGGGGPAPSSGAT